MSKKFMVGVPYLEEGDINDDGTLKPSVTNNKNTLVLLFAPWCPHCTHMMADYEALARENPNFSIVCCDSQADKGAAMKLSRFNKRGGVPCLLGFSPNGRFIKTHESDRSKEALKNFVTSL
jgi:thiol-disulfide isomerase/thioredoxin